MTVKVSLDPNTSWVADWFLDNRSQDEKDKMLGHEQGHFNIVALLARDMFMEYRAMLDNTYKTSNALAADVQKIASRYTDTIIEVVEKLYDSRGETNHDPVNNDKAQAKWNALFSEALTSRTPLFTVMGVRGLTVPSQPQSPVTVTVPYDP